VTAAAQLLDHRVGDAGSLVGGDRDAHGASMASVIMSP
jgi:hypothetical protein